MVNKSYLSIKLMLLGAWDSQVLPGCGLWKDFPYKSSWEWDRL